jgi:hypothetical protein
VLLSESSVVNFRPRSHSSFKRIDNGAFPSSISEIAAVAGESGRKTEAQDAEKCSVPEGTCNNQNSPRTGEQRVTGARLHILSTAFSIATFMVAIDRTILGEQCYLSHLNCA